MDKKGLSSNEATDNLKKYGLNVLSKKENKSLLKIVLNQFKDSTIYLLIIAGVLSLLLKEYIDAVIIFTVLVINTLIGSFQEYKAEKSLDALRKLTSPMCKVYRDNKLISLEVSQVTIDDLIYIEEGDIVPADLKLIETNSLKIDESLLTGESIPVLKDANFKGEKIKTLGDKLNYAFSSSKVVSGNGLGVVSNVGMNSGVGKIAELLNDKEEVTPLQLKLEKVSKFLGIFTIVLAIVVFLIGILLQFNALEILVFSISLGVAAIPEGLPAVVTIVLSLGVKKMVKEKAIIRHLPAVETLGSVEIVCSDKTGTITKNELEVKEVFTLSNNNHLLIDTFIECNNVKDDIGDPLELSIVKYLKKEGPFSDKQGKRVQEIPFTSERKMMSVISILDGHKNIYSKGAYEVISSKCKYVFQKDKEVEFDNNIKHSIERKLLEMENKAYRVLAFAYSNKSISEENLTFLGLVGFIDPPRENIQDSIDKMKGAGITTLMITGDHKNTAYAIAKEVGIVKNIDECITGEELDELIETNREIDQYKVFSRVNPSHKVKIVDYYKKKNKVVAMTGDGVNDAPALKKADVGIAMGSGSEVCKSSADVVLIDNNFKTIEKSIEEGRNIYLNIKKAVLFLLSSNLGEVLSVVVFLLLKLPLPLLSIHILWVNLISDSFPALALGSDKKYEDIMKDKPRVKNESLFSKNGTFIAIFYGFLIFLITSISFLILPVTNLLDLGLNINLNNLKLILSNEEILNRSRTYAFTTLGISQLFHMIGMSNIRENLFSILKNNNWWRIVAFTLGILLQVLVTEIPFLINVFKTSRLSLLEWGWLILLSTMPLIIQQLIRKGYKSGL